MRVKLNVYWLHITLVPKSSLLHSLPYKSRNPPTNIHFQRSSKHPIDTCLKGTIMVTLQLIPGLVTLGRVSLTRVSGSSVSSSSLEAAGGLTDMRISNLNTCDTWNGGRFLLGACACLDVNLRGRLSGLEAAGGLAYGLCKQDTFESFHRGSE